MRACAVFWPPVARGGIGVSRSWSWERCGGNQGLGGWCDVVQDFRAECGSLVELQTAVGCMGRRVLPASEGTPRVLLTREG